jgi:hypothetical protein
MEKFLLFNAGTYDVVVFPLSSLRGIHPESDTTINVYFEFTKPFPMGANNAMYQLTTATNKAYEAIKDIYDAIATSPDTYITIASDFGTGTYVSEHITACAAIETENTAYLWGPGHNGYSTTITVLPRDFVNDEDESQRALVVEEDASNNLSIRKGGAGDMYATVAIPNGFKATDVRVYASATLIVAVFTGLASTGGTSTLETGNTSASIDITDTDGGAGKFLWIKVTTTAASDVIYGGVVTIAPR